MDKCKHENIQYYYQFYYMSDGDERMHWLKFCTDCGERLSKPWCKKPPLHLQETALEFKKA